jgi:MFS-type transporter involved in bile tolerance (Atg22 family)
MDQELLFDVNIWLLLIASTVLFLGATYIGFFLGRRAHQSGVDEHSRSQLSTIQAAILGLLALLLGFTFAMSMSRYDKRKQMVLEEANAIGTTFLRTQLLPEPPRQEISNLLRQYVDVRLEFYAAGIDEEKLAQAMARAEKLHKQIWSYTTALGKKDPRAVTTGLFILSLNEMIDMHAKRLTAMQNHVPQSAMILLYFLSTIAVAIVGYASGVAGLRKLFVTMMLPFLIAVVINVIVDIERPRRGLIKVGQERMIELRHTLAEQ